MTEDVGLDVSKEEASFCVKDITGNILASGKVATDLGKLGIALEVIDARQAHAVMRLQHNKTDANDAALLAEIARTGFCRPVAVKSETAQEERVLLKARAKADPACRLLMTAPGVGPVTALAFVSTIGDAERFAKSRAVGAYVGLTSRRWQSGEMDYSGRISKHGDAMLRSLLYEAANGVVRKPHPLKDWARRVKKRTSHKKACVALARKLAVILHRMTVTGEAFRWPEKEAAATVAEVIPRVDCKAGLHPRMRLIPWEAKAKGHYHEATRQNRRTRLRRQPCSRRRQWPWKGLTREMELDNQPARIETHIDDFSRFSVRSAWRGDTVYRKPRATTSEGLEKPPFRSPSRAAGGRRETSPMPRIAFGSAPPRRRAIWVSIRAGWYYS
jgi:hypothetical protein